MPQPAINHVNFKTRFVFVLLLLNALALSTFVHASKTLSPRFHFSTITIENGLLNNFVEDVFMDSQGFLWLSTSSGLSKYDGYEFLHFNKDTSPVRLKSNFVFKVCEDRFNRLWIASEVGIDVLDLTTMRLVDFSDSNPEYLKLANKGCSTVLKDSKGAIWISGDKSFACIDFKPDGTINELHTLSTNQAKNMPALTAIAEVNGAMWIGLKSQVLKIRKTGQKGLEMINVSDKLNLDARIFIKCFILKDNELWIGTDRGLFRYSLTDEKIRQYRHLSENPKSLSQSYISDLAKTKNNELIVGTLMGLNMYNPMTDDFSRIIKREEPNENSINCNFVNCLLSKDDIVYIGTEIGGLNIMTTQNLPIKTYVHVEDDPTSISKGPVNAIYEDHSGNLWIGTIEGGLNLKKSGTDQFIHYRHDPARLSSLGHNSVCSIVEDAKDHLLVGTWGGGLSVLNLKNLSSPQFKSYGIDDYPLLCSNFIITQCYDALNQGVWVGTPTGLNFYDSNKESILRIDFKNKQINGTAMMCTLIDRNSKLWIGLAQGFLIIDLPSFARDRTIIKYKYLRTKLQKSSSHSIEKVICMYETRDGTIWFGTHGNGLFKIKPGKNRYEFECFNKGNGLSSNTVMGILEDENSCLWLSTNNGLSCFNPKSKLFNNYFRSDGLISNQFYWNAFYRSKTEDLLYFGDLEGLISINTKKLTKKTSDYEVVFTKLNVLNKEIFPKKGGYLDQDISKAKTLHLHEKDKSFSIEFSALNFQNPEKAKYLYRLIGFDNMWVKVSSNRRVASYTNLKPGKYVLQVKYGIDENSWSNDITELEIIVSPFFYKTWWFLTLVFALFMVSGYQLYQWRVKTLQKQKELLKKKVEDRTHELEIQKTTLENQTLELSTQNILLVQQNEKITRQKLQLVKLSRKIQESTIDKLSFFTNITHEFRTPITLIIGPIERALKLSKDPLVSEQLHYVERNSKYLLSLINQLMDFRKVDSGTVEIVKIQDNFLHFLDTILLPFKTFAGERGIIIEKYYRLELAEFLFDEEFMRKVMINLLSNAIKFTPDYGIVRVFVTSVKDPVNQKEKLFICINDNGLGIPEEDLSKIFNRFYQSKHQVKYNVYAQSGTGIGLYLCKRIIQLHGGTIYAKNNATKGASFRVLMPLLRKETDDLPIQTESQVLLNSNSKIIKEGLISEKRKLTILVVEDNKDMCEYIQSILSEQYHVLKAENGKEGLIVLAQNHVDFIISDLMMPVMDGLEFSKKVKENITISHIPILILTALSSPEKKIQVFKIGIDEYLLKPFDEELLLTRIENILESRKPNQKQFIFNMNVDVLNIDEQSKDRKLLNKAMQIIKDNYENSYFEVSDFIEEMGISKTLLNKKLHELTGLPSGKLIQDYRLNIARELILKNKSTKDINISEIAYKVGFNDPKYFSRSFAKHFGMAPSALLDGD